MIDQCDIAVIIITNCSCKGAVEQKKDELVAVITTETAVNPIVVETMRRMKSKFTDLYDKEEYAFLEALTWPELNQKNYDTIASLLCVYNLPSRHWSSLRTRNGRIVYVRHPSTSFTPKYRARGSKLTFLSQ